MTTIELHGTWQLSSRCGTYACGATIPGDTHSALLDAELIKHPYNSRNELDVQHLNTLDWAFTRQISIYAALLAHRHIFLHCDSIDTISEIYVNDQLVGSTDNMFRRYRFDLKPYLCLGVNELEVRIFRRSRRRQWRQRRNSASVSAKVACAARLLWLKATTRCTAAC